MSTTALVLIGLSIGTYGLKAAGPLLLGGRRLPARLDTVSQLLPAALLAALVVVSTVADGRNITVDARLLGVVAAGIALWRRAPFVVVVIVAVAVTAAVRTIA